MSHMPNKTGPQPVAIDAATDDVFDTWQPRYAERGIATFPVKFVVRDGKLDKIPAVRNYMILGLRASTELTRKFANAQGIGIALGTRNGIAVVDADTKNENVVADVLAYYGPSPLIARSPSGGHHVYYRHNGRQRRRIRDPYWRERGAPVDVLGNGFITAPASRSPKGDYAFVQGGLDDLQRLPVMRASAEKVTPPESKAAPESPLRGMREHDGRNTALFMAIGPIARDIHQACGTREQLLQIARGHNAQCEQPRWHYTPKHGSWLDLAESELGVLTSQCLNRQILIDEIAAWEHDRNANHTKADWQFTTKNARIKLKHLYPAIC
jgi:Bifunctional DNA primase/polymerase, N-terminal